MESKLLQPFLQAGLIEVGDSDERLSNIEKSIEDLQKKLGDYSLLPSYTLVALDPNIAGEEQVLIETEEIVVVHWKALRAKFSERPRTLLRAVILNALYNLGMDDEYAARVIYLTACNFYPYAKLGREKSVVEKIILDLGNVVEQNATEEWALTEEEPVIKLKAFKITEFKLGTTEIKKEQLKADLKIAVSNEPTHGHGSQNGGNSFWGEHFAIKSSEAISNAFNLAMGEFNRSLSPTSIETPINNFFADFKKSLENVLKSTFKSTIAVERRSKLLWWKETLYSPSIKDSYRTLNESIQPIVMAVDLYHQLPHVTPASVEHLLRDSVLLLNNEASEKQPFSEYLSSLSSDETQQLLIKYFEVNSIKEGRVTFTDFLSLLVHKQTSLADFFQKTGIKASDRVSLCDIAVMVLRDLLTHRLIIG